MQVFETTNGRCMHSLKEASVGIYTVIVQCAANETLELVSKDVFHSKPQCYSCFWHYNPICNYSEGSSVEFSGAYSLVHGYRTAPPMSLYWYETCIPHWNGLCTLEQIFSCGSWPFAAVFEHPLFRLQALIYRTGGLLILVLPKEVKPIIEDDSKGRKCINNFFMCK